MKSSWLTCFTVLAMAIGIGVLAVPAAAGDEDLAAHPSCPFCGMDRVKFAHSRVLIRYDDGIEVGTCSLHCAAIDLSLKIDKTPAAVQVADYNGKTLIDAETAHWVTGGDKMGVMTRRAKWAFASAADARAFIDAHGGSAAEFEAAVKAAFEDMYTDLHMIREKRKMMRAKKSP